MNKLLLLLLLLLICYHIIKFFSATLSVQFLGQEIINWPWCLQTNLYTAISRKVVGKNVHATIPKGNMGYDRYNIPDDCSCRTYFCCFPLALANTFSWPFMPILLNFFEEQRTQNHPQCLSGLSRALFPTTFLQIAV